jgi:hypothetical protein
MKGGESPGEYRSGTGQLLLVGLLGLTLGLTFGLVIAWQWLPLSLIEAAPADLEIRYKEDYIRLVAATYADDQDLAAAQSRLRRLRAGNIGLWVADLAAREVGHDNQTAQNLTRLARALGVSDVALKAIPAIPTSTVVATSPSVTATPGWRFFVASKRLLSCRDAPGPAQIRVYVRDEAGSGVSGIRLVIAGARGQEFFFTGLKGTDPGYADYNVITGTYTLAVDAPGSEVASDLRSDLLSPECPPLRSGRNPPHAWEVTFQQVRTTGR